MVWEFRLLARGVLVLRVFGNKGNRIITCYVYELRIMLALKCKHFL